MTAPSCSRYACLWVPGFAAAALVRQDPALRGRPVAALRGATIRTVVAVTADAAAGGARAGMSATEAATRVPDLVGRMEDPAAERAAAGALLDAAWATSPRIEVVEPGTLSSTSAGSRRSSATSGGSASGWPRRARRSGCRSASASGRRGPWRGSRRGVAAGFLVVPPGAEEAFLAPRALGLLDPAPDLGLALERWGIGRSARSRRSDGGAPRAPRPGGRPAPGAARGADPGPFVPHLVPEPCREAVTLDWEVPSLPALAFVLDRLLAQLAARLALREAGAAALRLTLRLADGGVHEHRLGVAAPLRDGRTLGRLVRAELEALRLPAPVVAVSVEAEPVPLAALQADFFAPPRPSPRELGEILGRLAALVGADRVGAPVAPDTHRPDAIVVAPFPGGSPSRPGSGAAFRPPARGVRPPPWVTGAALVRRRLCPRARPGWSAAPAGRAASRPRGSGAPSWPRRAPGRPRGSGGPRRLGARGVGHRPPGRRRLPARRATARRRRGPSTRSTTERLTV